MRFIVYLGELFPLEHFEVQTWRVVVNDVRNNDICRRGINAIDRQNITWRQRVARVWRRVAGLHGLAGAQGTTVAGDAPAGVACHPLSTAM